MFVISVNRVYLGLKGALPQITVAFVRIVSTKIVSMLI